MKWPSFCSFWVHGMHLWKWPTGNSMDVCWASGRPSARDIENILLWSRARHAQGRYSFKQKGWRKWFSIRVTVMYVRVPSLILNWLIVADCAWERYNSGHGGSMEEGRLMMFHFSITRQMAFLSKGRREQMSSRLPCWASSCGRGIFSIDAR